MSKNNAWKEMKKRWCLLTLTHDPYQTKGGKKQQPPPVTNKVSEIKNYANTKNLIICVQIQECE